MSSRILVIEDESSISDFLVRGLREEGYVVELASDGREGWFALKTGEWDLVLLDWWLPVEDGIQILGRFRQQDRKTPVIFLTARDAISNRVDGLDAGADDYLCKPFSFDELLARVRALLRRQSSSDSIHLTYRDIEVDLVRQQATRGGHPLELTAREILLLIFFLRHPDRLLTRTRIYDSVWGEIYDGVSNTLEVHIKELRRKLEAHGERVIQTRRGQGYMLSDRSPGDA